jgi:ribosomal protein S18 acetylase RimI-like enzyme
MSEAVIRRASPSDASAIGRMHVKAWRETYAGLIPDEVLAQLDPAQRATMWRDNLTSGRRAVFVSEVEDDIVGFGACGSQRDASLPYHVEFAAVYVLRRAQRHGIGWRLMAAMARELIAQGHIAASLWVLEENATARAFYERLGGKVVARREQARDGFTSIGVAYAWDDLSVLL